VTGVHLLVGLGSERYALPIECVLEVADSEGVSPVLGAPAAIRGVRNLRGEVLPVVELGHMLGLAPARERGPLVVVEGRCARAMLAVDDLIDVSAPAATAEGTDSKLVRRAMLADGRLVGELDIASLLEAVRGATG
jgi:purine-binding chemotaxis protein CheW